MTSEINLKSMSEYIYKILVDTIVNNNGRYNNHIFNTNGADGETDFIYIVDDNTDVIIDIRNEIVSQMNLSDKLKCVMENGLLKGIKDHVNPNDYSLQKKFKNKNHEEIDDKFLTDILTSILSEVIYFDEEVLLNKCLEAQNLKNIE